MDSFFGIGGSEFLLVAILAAIILGPERLVKVARTAGKHMRNFKAYFASLSDELKSELDVLDEIKKESDDLMK